MREAIEWLGGRILARFVAFGRRKIDAALQEIEPLLSANRFGEADSIILSKIAEIRGLLPAYEYLKHRYIFKDLALLKERINFMPTDEQIGALVATGNRILWEKVSGASFIYLCGRWRILKSKKKKAAPVEGAARFLLG